MRTRFAFIRHERILLFLMYAAIAIAFMSSISTGLIRPMIMDYMSHISIIVQGKMALAEGQFPFRVAPFEHWRYPLYQFYSPSAYMFAAGVYRWLTPANPMMAFQVTLWISMILGGVYMNRLAYWLVKSRPAALLASIVYLASPYYLIVINHIGAFTEALALGIVPATLYYTVQRYTHPAENKTLLQVALAWYLLATTHLITFAYTSLFAALLLVLVTLKNYKHWLNLIDVGIAYAFGCFLALWYLAPVALVGKYLQISEWYNVNDFANYRVTLANLLTPAQGILNIKPDSVTGNISVLAQIHPNLGIPILLAAGICIYVFLTRAKSENARVNYWLPALIFIFLLSVVIAWSPINIWPSLPRALTIGQYSWRLLSQSIWIGSLLFAWALTWLFKNELDEKHILLGIFLILMTATAWLPVPERPYETMDVSAFKQNPMFFVNKDVYVIDVKHNMNLVHAISDVPLGFVYKDHGLMLNHSYPVKSSVVVLASAPYIAVDGKVYEDDPILNQNIGVLINGALVANHVMSKGDFHWEIPLAAIKKSSKKNAVISLEFKSKKLKDRKIYLPAEQVMLSGFLDPKAFLDVKKVEPLCKQEKDTTVCTIKPETNTDLIALPINYYPDLLNVTINEKAVAYTSVLTQDRIVAAVQAQPGIVNTIKIQFRGLAWANSLSTMSWGLWFMFLLFIAVRSVTARRAQ